jgi:hypothetical protein
MKITKELLQSFCKDLGIPKTGNKSMLQKRICGELCSPVSGVHSEDKIGTLRGLIRKQKWEKVKVIANDIKEMLDDDSSEGTIVRSLGGVHGVKLEKYDVAVFADLVDAYDKKDYEFIKEKIEEVGKARSKYAVALLRTFVGKSPRLIEALEE